MKWAESFSMEETGGCVHTGQEFMKIYYLDPQVLLQNPGAPFSFEEHLVVLPTSVFKVAEARVNKTAEQVSNAQKALRMLERRVLQGQPIQMTAIGEMNEEFGPGFCTGKSVYKIDKGGYLLIDKAGEDLIHAVTSFYMAGINGSKIPFRLVSQDVAVRAHALAAGIPAEIYRGDTIKGEPAYKGRREICLSSQEISRLYKEGCIKVPDGLGMVHNEYAVARPYDGSSDSALVWFDQQTQMLRTLSPAAMNGVYGVKPRNVGQKFLIDALMRDVRDCPLVIVQGRAGTAKTFLTLAAGLEQVMRDDPMYRRILVTRPNVKFDETLGFLKGGEEEKIAPLLRPIMDNLDQLTSVKADKEDYFRPSKKHGRRMTAWEEEAADKLVAPNSYAQELVDSGKLVGQAMEYMRGRSITDTFIIVDECQNCSPLQVHALITRVGKGSKIILEGDPAQVDNPSLSSTTNGLTWASQRMRGSPLCAQLFFEPDECERSKLAEEALKRLSTKTE